MDCRCRHFASKACLRRRMASPERTRATADHFPPCCPTTRHLSFTHLVRQVRQKAFSAGTGPTVSRWPGTVRSLQSAPDCDSRKRAALSFEAVVREIYLPLTSGATLCLPESADDLSPQRFWSWLADMRITTVVAVPSCAEIWLSICAERPATAATKSYVLHGRAAAGPTCRPLASNDALQEHREPLRPNRNDNGPVLFSDRGRSCPRHPTFGPIRARESDANR